MTEHRVKVPFDWTRYCGIAMQQADENDIEDIPALARKLLERAVKKQFGAFGISEVEIDGTDEHHVYLDLPDQGTAIRVILQFDGIKA